MPPVTPPRRRPVRGAFSRGHLVVALTGLVATVLTVVALRQADHRVPVLAAARELRSGAVLDGGSLRTVLVRADTAALDGLVAADDAADVRGKQLARPLRAGHLLSRDLLLDPADGTSSRSMSFPVPRARAVSGAIAAGDRVDVIAVDGRSGRAVYVAVAAEVMAVDLDGGGPLASTDDVVVTIATDAKQALRIAAAVDAGTVTLVRSTGAPRVAVATRRVDSGARAARAPGGGRR